MKTYDVAIIGAGTAGLSARREVAKMTDNYVVIDPGPLGTTCARVGCMPSKVLIQVANDFHRRLHWQENGIEGGNHLKMNSQKVMQHVRNLRDRFLRAILKEMETWRSTHLIPKKARFVSVDTLDLEGETIRAKKIIVATGSVPVIPASWRPYQKYFLDTDTIFDLQALPARIAVIGLGVIGIEIGQALSRLGVSVTGIDIRRTVGGLTDPELQRYAIQKFSEELPLFFDGAEMVGENEKGLRIRSGSQEWDFEKVFLSLGRRPNLDGLGLKEIGITHDSRGIPIFSTGTYQIQDAPIYLAGDVNAERPVLHEAADEGRIAGYNSVRENPQCFVRRTFLGIVFSSPNIAMVGENYQKLQEAKIEFEIGQVSFEGQGRAIVKQEEIGLLRIYGEKKTGKLLGAELLAPQGEHLAHLIAWAISLNLTVFEVLSLPFYHPVIEEGLRTALRDLAVKIERQAPPLEVLRCQDPPIR